MGRYVMRRLAQLVPALATILVVTFAVIHMAPGDPAASVAGEYATEESIADLRRQFGLDRPMWSQFGTYAGRMARGDFGDSFVYGRPVTTIIGERLFATLLLAATALVISVTVGILIGRVAARRPSGPLDAGITSAALLGYAIPGFWLGQLAILYLAINHRWFPAGGMEDLRIAYTGFDHVMDVAHHLFLPALVLATSEVALIVRLTRTGLIQQMGEGYVRTAQSKGLDRRYALARHAFPNAALPLITVIGSRVGFLFSGAVVVETVFSWPGLGTLLVAAVNNGDRPVALGMVTMVAVSVLLANLVTDLVYARIDPRIRYD